ncbi:YIP1 family protein [Paracoccus seriniphilus]|uniref:Yip1 domain-containing protein n=1 Tax=Paracoccus seriniphilus TaxID=184748 RepID=A0A239PW28_9RHOB|nr:YIP1 family protein [Paracoccus seriniphilus]WCR13393.1 YIP1 family protein [Paracoccus seriniphilus]SNT74360.1 Yip1 domain-containing protein [Paracoccus seriniphilus]
MSFGDMKALLGLTFRNPEAAARMLMGAGLPMQVRWMGLFLAVALSAILAWLSSQMFPLPDGEVMVLSLTAQPLAMAVMQLCAIVLAAGLMAAVGRLCGGHGNFADALLLTVWIEVVLLVVQVVQVVASVILPPFAGILGIMAIALFLWLTVHFTKALHGFRSSPKVFLGLVATAFLAGFALSVLAAAFGLFPEIAQ